MGKTVTFRSSPGSGVLGSMAVLGILAAAGPGAGQAVEVRVVIGSDTACRTQPDISATVPFRYQVGDVFVPSDQRKVEGDLWYLNTVRRGGGSPGCWIRSTLTADWSDRETALTVAADRILSRTDDLTFPDPEHQVVAVSGDPETRGHDIHVPARKDGGEWLGLGTDKVFPVEDGPRRRHPGRPQGDRRLDESTAHLSFRPGSHRHPGPGLAPQSDEPEG